MTKTLGSTLSSYDLHDLLPHGERKLSANSSAGATTISIDEDPVLAANVGFIVIDPFTSEAEVRKVTNVSGTTLTVAALTYAHASGDRVLFVEGDRYPISWWGAKPDESTDCAPLINAAFTNLDAVVGGGTLYVPAATTRYRCLSEINQQGTVILEGDGEDSRLWWPNDLGAGSYGIDLSVAGERPTIRDILLEGPYQPAANKPTVKAITGATVAGGTTTFACTAHGLSSGDRVLVVDVLMTSGSGVNGLHVVSGVPNSDSFSVAVTTTSTTYSSGGIAIDPGVSMDGINSKVGVRLDGVRARGFFAGLIPHDKTMCLRARLQGNFYGVYFNVSAQGDIHFYDSLLDTNRMASLATTDASKGIGSNFTNCHLGDGPYCFYLEPTANYTDAPLIAGSILGCSLEGYGNAVLWGDRKDGSLTAGTGTGTVNALWRHMGDGTSVGQVSTTIAERPQTWGYRTGTVQNFIVDAPDLFLEGAEYSQGLFDFGSIAHMEIRQAKTTFTALGSKKLLRDDCSAAHFELQEGDFRMRVIKAAGAITAGDLLQLSGDKVTPCTTGSPVGVARLAASGANVMVPVIVEARNRRINTTIANGAGQGARLIPDSANAGKVKAAAASTDPDQVGIALFNSNGSTVEARLKGLA